MKYKTSRISPHLKFGTVSPREVYKAFKENEGIVKQLFWREFFINIGYKNRGFESDRIFQPRLLHWDNTHFRHWKNGTTGLPIVDAIMREIKETGFCKNRGRLIVAEFAKLILLDWKHCEKYFARSLIDFDLILNHFNWNYVYSFGSFSSPWTKILNPYNQSKIYDKNAEYIKKWIPELKDIPIRDIHNWETAHMKYKGIYRKPVIVYKNQYEKCHRFYKKLYG